MADITNTDNTILIESRLTTIDNPYNPFDQFDQWFLFDVEKGYNTCARLARLLNINDDMTDLEEGIEVQRAQDALIQYDALDIYKKVYRNS